ncbi:MAG: filamentous hemagglutinin family protein [Sulfuricella sp.]
MRGWLMDSDRTIRCDKSPRGGGSRFPRLTASASTAVLAASGMLWLAGAGLACAAPLVPQALLAPLSGTLPNRPGGAAGYQQPTVKSGRQTDVVYDIAGNTGTISQSTARAILEWNNFNIASDSTVVFKSTQPGLDFVTLNRVLDPSANPSQIYGTLKADHGQIYLINRNGILFGSGAQVDVGALIASALNISDGDFAKGLLPNVQNMAQNHPFNWDGDSSGLAALSGKDGFLSRLVKVESGASINADEGGFVMLLGPKVTNNGRISTPGGQTVLAAGATVYLGSVPKSDGDRPSQDNGYRGFLVEVDPYKNQDGVSIHGEISNYVNGLINAPRGGVTLVGYAINQSGRISATTSVNQNGVVRLLARDTKDGNNDLLFGTSTGSVEFGQGSRIEVLPEETYSETLSATGEKTRTVNTIQDAQVFHPSIVDVVGGNISMLENSSIRASGGVVNLFAQADGTLFNPPSMQQGNASRVYMAAGSQIDVSGTQNVKVAADRDVIAVDLRGSVVQDNPLLRDSPLYGKTIWVDIRKGTSLLDISSYVAQIGRTAGEKTSAGGSVAIKSEGDIVLRDGSTVNFSGGSIDYAGGVVRANSKFVSQGRLYDVATASPNLVYSGIVGTYSVEHQKWGVTETFNGPGQWVYSPAYQEGQNAGQATFSGYGMALNGSLLGQAKAGPTQLDAGKNPLPGMLSIVDISGLGVSAYMPVVFATQKSLLPPGFTPDGESQSGKTVTISTEFLRDGGIGRLKVSSNGKISVPEGVSLDVAPSSGLINTAAAGETPKYEAETSSVTLTGGLIDVAGPISAPSGKISLTSTHGDITLGPDGTLNARGAWVNNTPAASSPADMTPVLINGGSITLNSGVNVTLAPGSLIDVSGGAKVDAGGKLTGGNGGSIAITSGYVEPGYDNAPALLLDGELRGYGVGTEVGGGSGGSLTLSAQSVRIAPNPAGISTTTTDGELNIDPAFFRKGGFASYTVNGQNGLTVAAGSDVRPQAASLVLGRNASQRRSGADVYSFSQPLLLPPELRQAASISLAAADRLFGALTLEQGAAIRVEPTGSVNLAAGKQLTVLGSVDAPAGNIGLSLNAFDKNNDVYDASQSIWIGATARLNAAGYAQYVLNNTGLRLGEVLRGGNVTINAGVGYVVAENGSVIDVSGLAPVTLDILRKNGRQTVYVPAQVAGDAGSISITAREGMFLDGKLLGAPGGGQAAGGTLALTLARAVSNRIPSPFPGDPVSIVVQGEGASVPTRADGSRLKPGDWIDTAYLTNSAPATPAPGGNSDSNGKAFITAKTVKAGGFDSLVLTSQDNIEFRGGSDLSLRRSITLDSPDLVFKDKTDAGNQVNLTAAYVSLGNSVVDKLHPADNQTSGNGLLAVNANLIDVEGTSALQGFSNADFYSKTDIRLKGVSNTDPGQNVQNLTLKAGLSSNGDLQFTANQMYPASFTDFTLAVLNPDGSTRPDGAITVNQWAPGLDSPVLSAGGKLTLIAATIDQQGALKAPFGSIVLGDGSGTVHLAPGSVTSVSAEGLTIPFGLTQLSGLSYQYGGKALNATPPEKRVLLDGDKVEVDSGATINLTGGGDLYAYEFIAGRGGSRDVLDPANGTAYAILPWLKSAAPYDYQEYHSGTSSPNLKPGDSIYLAASSGLAAGYYTLLPARYALLDGAYLVKPVAGYRDMSASQSFARPDGTTIVPGYLTTTAYDGSLINDNRFSGFAVAPGAWARSRSEYLNTYASSFYANNPAFQAPADAGRLAVAGVSGIALQGTLLAAAASGGRGAEVDISSQNIVIGSGTHANAVTLDAETLNNLGAASLLIGGIRSSGSDGVTVAVGAANVTVADTGTPTDTTSANPNSLHAPEIILAATDQVTVETGATVAGTGKFSGTPKNITVAGNGALLRVSSGDQATIARPGSDSTKGDLIVESGAHVKADKSMLLDATRDSKIAGGSTTLGDSAALGVSSRLISIGDVANVTDGLAYSNADMAQFDKLSRLSLISYSTLDLYGKVVFGNDTLNLDLQSAGIRGFQGATAEKNVAITANTFTLSNPSGTAFTSPGGSGDGSLGVTAQKVVLGKGGLAPADANGNQALRGTTIEGFDSVTLAANEITGTGSGSLNVKGSLTMRAARLTGEGAGVRQSMTATGPITFTRPGYLDPAYLATQTAEKQSELLASFNNLLANLRQTKPPLDARFELASSGGAVEVGGIVDLPSGGFKASAATDVTLTGNAQINAGGVAVPFVDIVKYAPGGNVELTSAGGNVKIDNGAVVDVSGADGGDAGSLKISAAAGAATLDGTLKGYANPDAQGNVGKQGSFSLDVATLDSGFSDLNGKLAAKTDSATGKTLEGGFSEAVDVRVRSGDLSVAATDTVKAHQFSLEADNGKIDVAGTVDASGDKGGSIGLYASGDVTLKDGAKLWAYATKPGNDTAGTGVAAGTVGQGGKVTLASTSGWIDVQPNSAIDVHGGGNGAQDGSVLLRAKRNAANTDVNVKQIAGIISGASEVVVEGYKAYDRTSISASDVATSGTMYSDAKDFMGANNANATTIKNRIDKAGAIANLHVRPGIEVDSSGDLTLNAVWDLHNWRFGGEPGVLTLRAGGNLNIEKSLSDGFDSTKALGSGLTADQKFVGAPLVDTVTWSYRLAAGADLGAASPLAVEPLAQQQTGKGSLIVAPGIPRATNKITGPIASNVAQKITAIRTGTGDIDIAAGRDVVLKNAESVIYTAGRPDSLLAGTKDSNGLIQPANFYPDTFGLLAPTASASGNYPKSGGDITIRAQGDVTGGVSLSTSGVLTTQLIGDWLFRRGSVDAQGNIASGGTTPGYANLGTTWFIYFPEFEQNVGALGGGDVSVVAGGNINNLSVVIPTTGWLSGKAGDPALLSNLHVNGGGDLTVRAGENIAGGLFYVGQGQGTISAGGSLLPWTKQVQSGTSPTDLHTILALGGGAFQVQAGGDLNLGAVLNPTVVGQIFADTRIGNKADYRAQDYFYTYAADSSVSLNALSGKVSLLNDSAAIMAAAPRLYSTSASYGSGNGTAGTANQSGLSVYPPTLRAAALQGGVEVSRLTLFPSASGNLELLAKGSVTLKDNLTVSDADPALLSTAISSLYGNNVFYPQATIPNPPLGFFSTMLHEGDNNPIRVYALDGNITSKDKTVGTATLQLPKQARLVAGQDIINFNLIGQNLASTDVTGLTAGRDVLIASTLDAAGNIASNDKKGVTIGGPGRLEVVAGRSVDLGTSDGIVSRGNLDNTALPRGGASIAVSAGVAGEAGYSQFVEKYFSADERKQVADYVRTTLKQPALTDDEALAAFGDPAKFPYGQGAIPPAVVYAQEIRRIFFDELKQAGIDHSKGGNYDRGFNAVAALFPAAASPGDINLFFSQIKTEQGGDIELMAPDGQVNAGLASATGVSKTASELGIITVDGGSIRSFSRGDFLVNQSRVFTLGGGDILIWSSEGDIDAGKGSKTASATPPPTITTDPNTGIVTVDTSNAVSGSGIGVLLAKAGISAGRTDLIAPKGTVNAGDAGIRAAGDLNIAALHVVGAENIQFGGVATGVPTANSGGLGTGLNGLATVADNGVASEITKSLAENSENQQKIRQAMADFRPTFITVEVIGLGD